MKALLFPGQGVQKIGMIDELLNDIPETKNIINDQKFFIAASHQSMFETFFLQTLFNSPIFILKKELLKIPIFGWYLKKIGSVSIKSCLLYTSPSPRDS